MDYSWLTHNSPLFIHGNIDGQKSKKQVDEEMYNMGGSIVEIYRKKNTHKWMVKQNSSYNKRITAQTKIPFADGKKIKGEKYSIGMVANCAGGTTPWGTVLTCEENYDSFHGERKKKGKKEPGVFGWEKYYDYPPETIGLLRSTQ